MGTLKQRMYKPGGIRMVAVQLGRLLNDARGGHRLVAPPEVQQYCCRISPPFYAAGFIRRFLDPIILSLIQM